MKQTHGGRSEHLGEDLIAAYLERRLSGDDARLVEAHLAECVTCRQEAREVSSFLRGVSSRRRWVPASVAALAAAAVVALVVVGLPGDPPGSGNDPFRAGPDHETEAVPTIAALAPAEGRAASPDTLVFAWSPAAPDASYRLTLTDDTGEIVWEEETADTALALPRDLALRPGGSYLWYVDAVLPDGGAVSTGVRELEIRGP